MKTATVLKKRFTKKQMIIIGGILAVPVIAGIVFGIFLLLQQTAISSRANDEAPASVVTEKIGEKGVKVNWETGIETSAILEYGTDTSSLSQVAISETAAKNHTVEINDLEPGTYYFQIRVGDTVYNQDGIYWTFTIDGEDSPTPDPSTSEQNDATDSGSISPEVSATVAPTPDPLTASESAEINLTPTPGINPAVSICSSTVCSQIKSNLGSLCTTQDYLQCVYNNSSSETTSTTTTDPTSTSAPAGNTEPTPTNASSGTTVNYYTKQLCKPKYIQANSCTSWSWTAMADIDKTCEDTYTKYFVQCKSNSFSSTDAATWYCNKTVTSNDLTLPCDSAPTPPANQTIFCRVRAETAEGGAKNATDWIEMNATCPAYTSGNISACEIQYLQGNTCRSWIWDLKNGKDAECANAFSKYFFQCTSNGNFDYITTTPTPAWWYCNTTSEDHYLDFPCYNAITPADGAGITCRVRAEDQYGGTGHSTAWTTNSVTCPTSTPTPSITSTPTYTPTPTYTLTPTPTP